MGEIGKNGREKKEEKRRKRRGKRKEDHLKDEELYDLEESGWMYFGRDAQLDEDSERFLIRCIALFRNTKEIWKTNKRRRNNLALWHLESKT